MPSTLIPTFPASRLNPDLVAEDTPIGDFVSIDEPNGNNWVNQNNRMLVIIKNTSAVNALIATFAATSNYSGIALPDEVVSIPATEWCFIGPWPDKDFAAASGAKVIEIAWTGTTPLGKILILDVRANNA